MKSDFGLSNLYILLKNRLQKVLNAFNKMKAENSVFKT